MILLFLFAHFIKCDETSTKICVYSSSLPSVCEGIDSIDVSKVADLDSAFDEVKTKKMIVMFSPIAKAYRFKLSTFSKIEYNFTSTDKNSRFSLEIECKLGSTYSMASFEYCDIKFIGIEKNAALQFDLLDIGSECSISFENIKSYVSVQAADLDHVFESFSEIVVNGGMRNPDLTITTKNDITAYLNEMEVILNDKVKISYTNENYRDIEIINSPKITVNDIMENVNRLPVVILRNVDDLVFTSETVMITPGYDIECFDVKNIYSQSSVLPISLSGEINTNIFITQSVVMNGDIMTKSITFINNAQDDYRKQFAVAGYISSDQIIINSSYIDLVIGDLRSNLNNYYRSDTFIHCIGKGGSSTVVAFTTQTGFVGLGTPVFNLDFDKYLPDSDLSLLINHPITYLTISPSEGTLESYISKPEIKYANESVFIHGFNSKDNVVTLSREMTNHLADSLFVSPPSQKELKLCVSTSTCSGGVPITLEDLKDLSKKYVFNGMKNVKVEINQDSIVSSIDFSNLPENVNISFISSNQAQINSLGLREKINVTLNSLKLPSFVCGSVNVTLIDCEFTNDDGRITVTDQTNLSLDSEFIKKGYYAKRIIGNKINALNIQIDPFYYVRLDNNSFIFHYDNDQKVEINRKDNIQWTTINFNKDTSKFFSDSNRLAIEANQRYPQFNITASSSTKDMKTFPLQLIFWTQIIEKEPIYVNHGITPIQIILTEPAYIDPMELVGTGRVTYVNDYSQSYSLCFYRPGTNLSKFPLCQSAKQYEFSEIDSKLKSTQIYNLSVTIANSSSADYPTVNMESLNKKVIYFIGEGSEEYLKISNENQLNDPKLSATYFKNLTLLSKSFSGHSEFVFGDLLLENSTFSDFDKSTLTIDDLNCDVSFFERIHSVTITDNLIISGDFNSVEKTIYFLNDDNAEDLKATVSDESVALVVRNGAVSIGKMTFKIEHSNDFDVVINLASTVKTVDISAAEGASFDQIPLVQINECKGVTFDFSVSESWPTVKQGEYIFNFIQADDTILKIGHENTPLQISTIVGTSRIIGTASKVGISGSLSNSKAYQTLDLTYETTTITPSELVLYEFNAYSDFSLLCLQPSSSITIKSVNGNDDPTVTNTVNIKLSLYNGIDGYSSIKLSAITSKTVRVYSSINIKLGIDSDIELNSVELNRFCSQNYTMLKIPTSIDQSITMNFIEPIPSLHGVQDAFKFEQDLATFSIFFYTETHPKYIPLALCYESTIGCDVTIPKDKLSNMSSLIPKGIQSVEIHLGRSISDSDSLNFDLEIFDTIDVEISGISTIEALPTINLELSKNKINSLQIDNLKVTSIKSGYAVKKLNINGALISDVSGFNEIEILDASSWISKEFNSYQNPIKFVSVEKTITFTSNGWKIGNEDILYENFPKLSVKFNSDSLTFEIENGQIEIKKLTSLLTPNVKNYIISKGWNLNEKNSFEIKRTLESNTNDEYTVTTSSFPFYISPLNVTESDNQVIRLTKDVELDNTKQIVISNGKLNLDNSESGELTFTDLVLHNSTLTTQKVVNFNTLTIKNVSNVSNGHIKNTLTIYGEATLQGTVDFETTAEIKYYWDIDETPEIQFVEFPANVVKNIYINFMKESISTEQKTLYNEFLYRKAFLFGNYGSYCRYFLEKVHFNSSVIYFNDDNYNILSARCSDGELIITGRQKIPIDPTTQPETITATSTMSQTITYNPDQSSGIKPGYIILITLSLAVLITIVTVLVVFYIRRRKSRDLDKSDTLSIGSVLINPERTGDARYTEDAL
ncbi:hypothetical protein TRFO_23368 [Tritrichomonas foetus]|uniref:Uncharacterized protein n=1 Tax=Tritrichomonas foetus TaxID=1144522 RepID=A0A1J4KEN4_9EUKA|nr:hypothetical protein TRFO_23368 [Tritrichomonas foetus]|eukprot:OHT08212.1 hypothetical protein TRFO_23368 [Tritrichomonas foetus]